jgi:hypothetical protein
LHTISQSICSGVGDRRVGVLLIAIVRPVDQDVEHHSPKQLPRVLDVPITLGHAPAPQQLHPLVGHSDVSAETFADNRASWFNHVAPDIYPSGAA